MLDELNYQFLRRLQKEGFVTLKSLFIDGTKIEANANRYTFVFFTHNITLLVLIQNEPLSNLHELSNVQLRQTVRYPNEFFQVLPLSRK